MKKKTIILPIVLLLAIIALYNPPLATPDFAEMYRQVDEETTTSLQMFRQNNPLQQIDVNGVTWDYLITGKGKRNLLFLHGMTGSYDIWWQQVLDFRDEYRVITLSYPPVNNLQELSAGVLKILDSAGIAKVNLIGSSLGGYFAQYLVANYPDRIEKAVFANTFPPNAIIAEKNKILGTLLPIVPAWIVTEFLLSGLEKNIYPAAGKSELVRAFITEQAHGKMMKEQFIARYHCVIDTFTPPLIDNPGIPVMIIEADNDPLVELALREMLKETYPSASVKTLHNVGHFPYLNEPDLYTGLLREFIQ